MRQPDYLQASEPYFWCWEENFSVLAVRKGSTIAYADYVRDVMTALAPRGLPPFGALLMAIAATNANGKTTIDEIYDHCTRIRFLNVENIRLVRDGHAFLQRLSELPPQWKQGRYRVLVLQTIFHDAHNRQSLARSRHLLTRMANLAGDMAVLHAFASMPLAQFTADFRALVLLGRQYPTTESIIDAVMALPECTEPPELPQPEADEETEARDFVDELMAEPASFHVGALVRRLWSGLNIPHHNLLPSEQPLGGVSDITNKGAFDRLLVSEFAYDDVLFLSRLANNEALFLNREVPPQRDNRERVLIIDSSLRAWGNPRAIAFALMLAIARHPRTDIPCRAYVVAGGYAPIQFDSVEGIVAGLQRLEPTGHAAAGMEALLRSGELSPRSELFYLGSAASAAAPRLHQVVNDWAPQLRYWLEAGNEGRVEVYRRQGKGRTLLQVLQLPLDELWAQKAPSKKKDSPEKRAPQAPPVLHSNLPLRVSTPTQFRRMVKLSDDEVLLLTKHRSILRGNITWNEGSNWNEYQEGWDVLIEDAPGGIDDMVALRADDGQYYAALRHTDHKKISFLYLSDGRSEDLDLSEHGVRAIQLGLFREDSLLCLARRTGTYNGSLPHRITWKGGLKIEQIKPNTPELYQELKAAMKEREDIEHGKHRVLSRLVRRSWLPPPTGHSTLRTWDNVGVTRDGRLFVNGHVLTCDQRHGNGRARFSNAPEKQPYIRANLRGQFLNGTSLTVHPDGLLLLAGPLESIYINSVLVGDVAMARGEQLAGNPIYLPENRPASMTVIAFFEQYIDPFIHEILVYGNKA